MYLNDAHAYLCPRCLVYEITKPLYTHDGADIIRLYSKWVDIACKKGIFLAILTPNGSSQFNPKWIRKNAKVFKQTFLRPDEPMRLYELRVPHGEKKPIEAYQFL